MKVDALAAPEARRRKTYFLIPGSPGVSHNDLQYREFAVHTARALKYRGYTQMKNAGDADVLVFLSYGIGEPKVEYELISSPVYGMVPSGTSQTTVEGTTTSYGSVAHTTATATTSNARTLGVVGASSYTRKKVEYDRFLRLAAIDTERYKDTGELVEVWQTTVTSSGSSDDLRRVFPVMMAGAMRRIGLDTKGKQSVAVTEQHPRVRYIRGKISASALRASAQ